MRNKRINMDMRQAKSVRLKRERVEAVIREKGLRKKWVAEKMGIHPHSLYAIINGDRTTSRMALKFLADLLGVNEEEIAA